MSDAASPVIVIEHLSKTYELGKTQVKALVDVTFDVERNDASASFFQKFQRGRFGAHQFPRRKNREMGRHVSHSRMELPAQFFYELANRIADVRHQRVA